MWTPYDETNDDCGEDYWPRHQSQYGPVLGWHAVRRHQSDLSLPAPYGHPVARFRPPLPYPEPSLNTPHSVPRFFTNNYLQQPPTHVLAQEKLYQDFNDPCRPVPLKVSYQTSAIRCDVSWKTPTLHRSTEFSYRVEAMQGIRVETMELGAHKTTLRMKTTPGQWYIVEVRAVTPGPQSRVIAFGRIEFKAVFSRDEMLQLHSRAVSFVGSSMHRFHVVYRCKPKAYYDDIRFRTAGMMEKYEKDENGQAASPINGKQAPARESLLTAGVIKGLFFSARLQSDGSLPLHSPFGNIRMMIPAMSLFDPARVRLYFSDFYCNYITHYVTVVVCERGSESDRFCERCLIPISAENNPFLQVLPSANPFEGPFEFWVNKTVWVEVYYTESVPLSWGTFDVINATGAGSSRPGGLPHNKTCLQCNLYPIRLNSDSRTTQVSEFPPVEPEELGEKLAADDDAHCCQEDNADLNSTFHLVMQLERIRLTRLGLSIDELFMPGNAEIIEVVCSLIDAAVAHIGASILVPSHGFVGFPLHESDEPSIQTSETVDSEDAKENVETKEGKEVFEYLKLTTADLDKRCSELQRILTTLQTSVLILEKKLKPLR